MMRLHPNILGPFVPYVLLVITLWLVYAPNFSDGAIFFGEALYITSFSDHLSRAEGPWRQINFGTPNDIALFNNIPILYLLSAVEKMGFGFVVAQQVWLGTVVAMMASSLMRLLTKAYDMGVPTAFLLALFYSLNPAFLSNISNTNFWLIPAFAAIPLSWLVIHEFSQRPLILVSMMGLVMGMFLFMFANPPYFLVWVLSCMIGSVTFATGKGPERIKQSAWVFGLCLLGIIAVSLPYYLSFLIYHADAMATFKQGADVDAIIKGNSQNATIDRILSLRASIYRVADYSDFHRMLNAPIAGILLTLPALVVFYEAVFRHPETALKVFAALFFALVVFSKGYQPPFEIPFILFFEFIPFAKIFKSAPEKFAPLVAFLLALSLALTLQNANGTRKRIYYVVAALNIGFLASISLQGALFADFRYQGIKVDRQYKNKDLDNLLNFLNRDLPPSIGFVIGDSPTYMSHLVSEDGEPSFWGIDPLIANSRHKFINMNENPDYSSAIGAALNQGNTRSVFRNANVNMVVIDRLRRNYSGHEQGIDTRLLAADLSEWNVFNNRSFSVYHFPSETAEFWTSHSLYTLTDRSAVPELQQRLSGSDGQPVLWQYPSSRSPDQDAASDGDRAGHNEDTDLKWEQVAPLEYEMTLTTSSQTMFLAFEQTFDARWQLSVTGSKPQETDSKGQRDRDSGNRVDLTHFSSKNGINTWLIDISSPCGADDPDCDHARRIPREISLRLVFEPSMWVSMSTKAAIFSFLLFLLVSVSFAFLKISNRREQA